MPVVDGHERRRAVANSRLNGLPLVVGLTGLKSEKTVSTSATRRSALIVRVGDVAAGAADRS